MNPVRWTNHAVENLAEREIDRLEAELTMRDPEFIVPDPPAREIYMRRYFDGALQQEMLMRVVLEQTESGSVVVTVYKTSQVERYMKEVRP